jgi:Family of unknown function (DUF6789)
MGAEGPSATRTRFALAALAGSSAAAVAVYIVARISLAAAIVVLVVPAGVAWWSTWRRLPAAGRAELVRRCRAGALAGIAATAAYNLARWALVEAFSLSLDPWITIRLFGRLLVGDDRPAALTLPVGIAFHVVNGIGLAVGFAVLFGGRTWRAGVAYAVALEVVMVALYPSWLDIRKMDEFVTVTFLAHVAYGATLAEVSRHILARQPRDPAAAPPPPPPPPPRRVHL